MHLDLLHPVLDIVVGASVVDRVGKHYAHGPAVVGLRDGLEPFLPGGVPDLQLDSGAIEGQGLGLEVDADGGEVRGLEGVLAEAEEEVGLADAAVADDEQLDQQVIPRLSFHIINK